MRLSKNTKQNHTKNIQNIPDKNFSKIYKQNAFKQYYMRKLCTVIQYNDEMKIIYIQFV